MILVISLVTDESTNRFCQWLNYLRKNFLRINCDEPLDGLEINITLPSNQGDIFFFVHDQKYNLNSFTKIWYRAGAITLKGNEELKNRFNFKEVSAYNTQEKSVGLNYFLKKVNEQTTFGKYFVTDINKLLVLQKAIECGLTIPDTIVTCNKSTLLQFQSKHKAIVIKPLSSIAVVTHDKFNHIPYTRKLSINDILKLDKRFTESLFQEYVKPFAEIRIFFSGENFYSMAIFSSSETINEVCDWRNVDGHSNRYVPFGIPEHLKLMLKKLNSLLSLNTGSHDFILTDDNRFYFLEVNPSGQFDFLDKHCNYHIARNLAYDQ